MATNALVAGPGIVRAAVTWASVSSSFVDNYDSLLARQLPDRIEAIRPRYGPPTKGSTFYTDLSSRTFFDRISEPVLLDHGTADPICAVGWSRATASHMEQAGVDVRLRLRRRANRTSTPGADRPRWRTRTRSCANASRCRRRGLRSSRAA